MLPSAPVVLGNKLWTWASALGAAGAIVGAVYALKHCGVRPGGLLGARLPEGLREGARESLEATRLPLVALAALCAGSWLLDLHPCLEDSLLHLGLLTLMVQGGLWGNRLIGWWLRTRLQGRSTHGETAAMTAPVLGFMLRLMLWTLILLLALDSFEVKLTALLASLGVGGIAVALAMQNILGDIFASLSIALDKPFVPGDFIIVGDCIGTVGTIGLKSTQIRSLSGEQIIVSNADLLKSRIRNFKRMAERRVLFTFGVTYLTEAAALERIPVQVRDIVQGLGKTRFDRAHLREFGDSALIFEVVYYVLDVDYNVYMDIQQAINLALFSALRRDGVAFAHPTRIVLPSPPN